MMCVIVVLIKAGKLNINLEAMEIPLRDQNPEATRKIR